MYKIDCIACGKQFEVGKENDYKNLIKCWDGIYVICPHCHRAISLESYRNKGMLCD